MHVAFAYIIAIIAFVIVLNFVMLFFRLRRDRYNKPDKEAMEEARAVILRDNEIQRRLGREQEDAAREVELRNRTLALYEEVRRRAARRELDAAGKQTPEISEIQAPEISEIQAPVVSEIQAPGISEIQAPGVSDIQTPGVSEIHTPVASETQAPGVSEIQAPVTSETQAPVVSETQAPVASETQTPVVSETQTPTESDVFENTVTAPNSFGWEFRYQGHWAGKWNDGDDFTQR